MNFDLSQLPFSKYGSYVSLTLEKDMKTFKLRNCRRLFGEEQFMDFVFVDKKGEVISPEIIATPYNVVVKQEQAYAEIIICDTEQILIRGENLFIKATPKGGWCFKTDENAYRNHVITNHNYTYNTVVTLGKIEADIKVETVDNYHKPVSAEYYISPNDLGEFEVGFQCTADEVDYSPCFSEFDTIRENNIKLWNEFLKEKPKVDAEYNKSSVWLWYNIWSSFIYADGNMKYDACLMSKSFMCAVWSWDHCFNALALLEGGDIKRCLEQFFLIFEMQSEEGKLPDFINTEVHWRAAVKPPVHGWCFGKIMDKIELNRKQLEKAYDHLERWTNWHFNYRDTDEDGIPEYIMGNDSGWDNSTLFDLGSNMETPDLPAYLYLQMKTLSRIANKLSLNSKVEYWDKRAETLLEKFIQHSWDKDGFVAKQSITHKHDEEATSLLALMPIVIGEYLPEEITKKLVNKIEMNHVTEYGVSTESIHSPKYLPNGYWRGPIWAPTTFLIVDGLRRCGFKELAAKIATRFCRTVVEHGAYENFDALTGEGLCDKGYTWTSSAALCLMSIDWSKEV